MHLTLYKCQIQRILVSILVWHSEIVLYYGHLKKCPLQWQLSCTISEGRKIGQHLRCCKQDDIKLETGLANLSHKCHLSNDQRKQMKLIPHLVEWQLVTWGEDSGTTLYVMCQVWSSLPPGLSRGWSSICEAGSKCWITFSFCLSLQVYSTFQKKKKWSAHSWTKKLGWRNTGCISNQIYSIYWCWCELSQ